MKKWLLLSGFLIYSAFIIAQTTVTGKITDSKTGNPITGATVKIKSTKKGTVTDNLGVFKLQASSNEELEISAIGFKTILIKVGSQSDISAALEQSLTDLGEVVVTGNRGM